MCICSKEFVFNKSHLKGNKFKVKKAQRERESESKQEKKK